MSNPSAVLFQFALESLPHATLGRQAEVYGALADLAADNDQRMRLQAEAAACVNLLAEHEAHARRHEQLVLNFQQRSRR